MERKVPTYLRTQVAIFGHYHASFSERLDRYSEQPCSSVSIGISIETLLSHSLGIYQITQASVGNSENRDVPFQFQYSFTAEKYAKNAGPLRLVRPRLDGLEIQRHA
jgi:3-dehydroquinate synthetase